MPIAKESGGNFTPVPAGTHVSRCVNIISLGTQPQTNPKFLDTFKVMIGWEIPDETVVVDGQEMPMMISKEYTLSLSEKANLRHDLESWRGRQFTPDELKGFEVADVVSAPCLLNVIHKTNAKGRTYASIASVSKLGKGMTCPAQVHPPVVYEVEQGTNEVFKSLPEWIQKKIHQCEEWTNPPIEQAMDSADPESETEDDRVPF